MTKRKGQIAVDLDGTLAYYEKFKSLDHIGPPIPKMLERVKRWLENGENVVIYTARVSPEDHSPEEIETAKRCIQSWCLEHVGQVLDVTACKRTSFYEFWDDRAVGVVKNTGERKRE